MSEADDAAADIDQRIEGVVDDADMGPIAEALARRRGEILAAWLKAALEQPFHADNPTASVADHIPVLLDNIIGVLRSLGLSQRRPAADGRPGGDRRGQGACADALRAGSRAGRRS